LQKCHWPGYPSSGSLGRLDLFSSLREHLGRGHGSAFIELRKAFSHGGPQGFLRLEQSQALGKHIAFGENSPLGDESLHERGQVGRDFNGHGLIAPMVGWSAEELCVSPEKYTDV
jgi:hypothetical protein